jgi:hypothetical protein
MSAKSSRRILACRSCSYRLDVHRCVIDAWCTNHAEPVMMTPTKAGKETTPEGRTRLV